MSLLKHVFPPLHPEGWRFVGVFAGITLALWIITDILAAVDLGGTVLYGLLYLLLLTGIVLTVWCYYFFRNPVRIVPQVADAVISPADGIISSVGLAVPPAELELSLMPLL